MKETPLAPAIAHWWRSSLVSDSRLFRLGIAPSKTQRFRWFHKFQALKITRELTPFWTWPDNLWLKLSHQSSNTLSSNPGASACSPRPCSKLNHICQDKTQETNKWSSVSSSFVGKNKASMFNYLWAHIYCHHRIYGCEHIFNCFLRKKTQCTKMKEKRRHTWTSDSIISWELILLFIKRSKHKAKLIL